jgi:SpoVK/Ycf46/Vps4 family AAA+-type ATPase
MSKSKYSHTVGKNNHVERIGESQEATDFYDSLTILVDRVNPFIHFDDDVLALFLIIMPESERVELVNDLLKETGSEKRLDRITVRNMRIRSLVQTIEEEAENVEKFYSEAGRRTAIDSFYRCFEGKDIEDKLTLRAAELKPVLGLDESEIRILTFLYLINIVSPLENILCSNMIGEFTSLTANALDIPIYEVRSAIADDGNLVQMGLIEPDYLPPPHFQVEMMVKKFFRTGSVYALLDNLKSVEGPVYPVESFPTEATQNEIVKRQIGGDQAAHILLYGTPGTGKTEYAKAVMQSVNKSGFFLSSVDYGETGEKVNRRLQLLMATKTLDPENSVLIVDEADHLLNSEGLFSSETEKGWVTDFIDSCPVSIIWISNSLERTHSAVLRRFTYSIEFRPSSFRTRENIWRNLIGKSPLREVLDEHTIKMLSRDYRVNVAGISSAINSAAQVYKNEELPKDALITQLQEMLRQHQRLIGDQEASRLKPLAQKYDLSFLNTDVSMDQVLTAARKYAERGGAPSGASLRVPLNILLWGEPGTGKTEFAKYLAEYLDRPLHINRASDLLSPCVGGTEANIAEGFQLAEDEKAILLLDEADTFFINRRSARHSWETSQTNELLTQMENYNGILVCSTNLLESLDTAVIRRFAWKIRFYPLRREDRVRLYKEVFSGIGEALSDIHRNRIEKLENLTPGDLYAVFSRFSYLGQEALTHESVISALEQEISYKVLNNQPRIGFVV